jgi:RNA polymerase sigma-70 factor, ECF subfamily
MVSEMNKDDFFSRYRSLLFSLAYRMLSSVQDAEDVVQEAYVRWLQSAQEEVRSPKDYLCATVTRLCIDHLRSARVRRETYFGMWLPEPLVNEAGADPGNLMMGETVHTAFLMLLERLSPVERAVFLLRDVFDYDYHDIAAFVEKGEANCRQIARRARQQLGQNRARFDVPPDHVEELTSKFLDACSTGEMGTLLRVLAPDVTLLPDGGGKARSAINPIYGSDRVARFMLGIQRKPGPIRLALAEVNGLPGLLRYVGERLQSVISFEVEDDQIRRIFMVSNPDKLPASLRTGVH